MALFIGLMSGTSMDGIDAALVELSQEVPKLVATHAHEFPRPLRSELREIASSPSATLERVAVADVHVGELFAQAALRLIEHAGCSPSDIHALGSHGQTICHQPNLSTPYSVQIGDPNIIAERTGITTLADFRRRDIAAGGQGAPLAPAFHEAVLRHADKNRIVVNIGGISNITMLPMAVDSPASGFDTGPGNTLLDAWANEHLATTMDKAGHWAAKGKTHQPLLAVLLSDRYFSDPPPKSTGREYFNLEWLEQKMGLLSTPIPSPQDTQRTLCELTTQAIAEAIEQYATAAGEVLVCGGGTHNPVLMDALSRSLPRHRVRSTMDYGLDPDWVEAMAFAWLAKRTLDGLAGNLPAVTGARHPVILGAIYPGKRFG